MGPATPLNRLVLVATSVADDLGYVALSDLSQALGTEPRGNYCVIGGHMVTALVARWQLGHDLYRETGDTDVGVPPVLAQDAGLIQRFMDLGYVQQAGNRFARTMHDVPVRIKGEEDPVREAAIDVLVPVYTNRPRQNVRFGDHLVTTEVPGLAIALNRPLIKMSMELERLNGQVLDIALLFPDEVSALVLKSLATKVRSKATDIVDVWRCLEVAYAAGRTPDEFMEDVQAESASVVRSLFATRMGDGMTAIIDEQRLSAKAANERYTRLLALIARVLG
jgi:hypothetical protein